MKGLAISCHVSCCPLHPEFFCSTRALLFPPQALENPPAEDRGEMIGEMCSSMALAFACRSYLSESNKIKQTNHAIRCDLMIWYDRRFDPMPKVKFTIHYHNLDVIVVIVTLSHALVFCHGVGSHSNPGWTTPVLAKSLKTKASPTRTKNMSWHFCQNHTVQVSNVASCHIFFSLFLPVPVKQAMKPAGESPHSWRDTGSWTSFRSQSWEFD
jgi:hypothetical protein